MKCPRCFNDNTKETADNHYVCLTDGCNNSEGDRTEFDLVEDNIIQFPYNQIFTKRKKEEFYKKPYSITKKIY